jgi:hypothetical protein
VLLFNRPLETSTVVWTVVVALLAVGVVELLRRPPAEAADIGEGGAATADVDAAATDADAEAALHRIDSARPAG